MRAKTNSTPANVSRSSLDHAGRPLRGAIWRSAACSLLALLTCVAYSGCGGVREEQRDYQGHFKALGVLHGRFLGAHQGRPPRTEAEFKEFIEKSGRGTFSQFGVNKVDELFVSPRDGQPLVFRFAPASHGDSNRVIAHEQYGVGGTRVVVTALGGVEWLNAQEFEARVN